MKPQWILTVVACQALLTATIALAGERPAATGKLFDPTHVVDVRIEMKPEDWDSVRFQSRSFLDALSRDTASKSPFKYSHGDVTIDGVRIENVGIRKKGFLGSLDEERPSLKIRFDKYVDQAPFGPLDRLTLNNNKQDASRLSQFLSYKLFNESGTVASRCNFAKVTVNGRSLGIYSNVESVKPPLLERGFGDGSGTLFEGTVVDLYQHVVGRFEGKSDDAERTDLQAIIEILAADELNVDELESYLDVRAFVRFWAMESLIGFWDGYTHNQNNFFVYRNPADSKFYFMPWGTDSAFTYSIPRQIDRIRFKSVHSQSVLANRFYRDHQLRQLYHETLVELLDTHWDEQALVAEVDRVESLLEGHIHESNSRFAKSVDKVRSFIKGRRRVLEKEMKRWPVQLTRGPREPAYTKQVGQGRATFSTQWYAKSPGKPESRGDVQMELIIDGEQVVFRQLGATAEPNRDWSLRSEDGQRPPTVILAGLRESDGKRLTLAMGLSTASFRPTQEPVQVLGVLIEGNMLAFVARMMFNPADVTLIGGQATFEAAEMEAGSAVQGNLDFKIMKFGGGKSPKVAWDVRDGVSSARGR